MLPKSRALFLTQHSELEFSYFWRLFVIKHLTLSSTAYTFKHPGLPQSEKATQNKKVVTLSVTKDNAIEAIILHHWVPANAWL